jgi:hypothetical protein
MSAPDLASPRPADREAAACALAGVPRRLPDRVLAHGPRSAAHEPEVAATRAALDAVRRLLDDRSPRVRAAAAVALAVAGDEPGPLAARRAREKDALVRTVLDVAGAVVRGDAVLLPGVPVEVLVERLFDRARDEMAWGGGFRASLAVRALIHLGPEARAAGIARLLPSIPAADSGFERVVRAGHLALLALPPDRPVPEVPDREPPDPDALDPALREVLAAIARLDAEGPQVTWPRELLEAMRCAGLPESTRGLRQYLGLVPAAGMEVRVTVRGARVPLFLACKRVALGTWPLAEVAAAVAVHPDPAERVEICATFNPWQYEVVRTRADGRAWASPPDGAEWEAIPLAAGAAADVEPGLLARARAAAAEVAAGRSGGIATTVLVALVRRGVPLGPELDPLVARAIRGVMRSWLAGPREVLAALPLARREALILALPAAPPTDLGPRGSGYAWDLADLAPTPAIAAHLRQGLAAQPGRPVAPETHPFVAAVLARVDAG